MLVEVVRVEEEMMEVVRVVVVEEEELAHYRGQTA